MAVETEPMDIDSPKTDPENVGCFSLKVYNFHGFINIEALESCEA